MADPLGAILAWPAVLAPRVIGLNPRGSSIASPRTLDGRAQVLERDAGWWQIDLGGMPVRTAAQRLAWRALHSRLRGGGRAVLLPIWDEENAPWLSGAMTATGTDFTDGTAYSDGTDYFEPAIRVAVSSAAAKRATSIEATIASAGTIAAGHHFSIHGRLYRIEEITASSGSDRTFRIWPPLRAAVPSGAGMNFDRPEVRARLVSGGDLDLDMGFDGEVAATFEEMP